MDFTKLSFDPSNCFVNGAWVEPVNGKKLNLINPSTGEILCKIARGTKQDIDNAVKAAETSDWKKYTALERSRALLKMSQIVLEDIELLAELEANDVGKPLKQAKADAVALARYLEFY